MGGFAPATRVRSVKLAPTHCSALLPPALKSRVVHENVREHVRQMADYRHDLVVRDRIDESGFGSKTV